MDHLREANAALDAQTKRYLNCYEATLAELEAARQAHRNEEEKHYLEMCKLKETALIRDKEMKFVLGLLDPDKQKMVEKLEIGVGVDEWAKRLEEKNRRALEDVSRIGAQNEKLAQQWVESQLETNNMKAQLAAKERELEETKETVLHLEQQLRDQKALYEQIAKGRDRFLEDTEAELAKIASKCKIDVSFPILARNASGPNAYDLRIVAYFQSLRSQYTKLVTLARDVNASLVQQTDLLYAIRHESLTANLFVHETDAVLDENKERKWDVRKWDAVLRYARVIGMWEVVFGKGHVGKGVGSWKTRNDPNVNSAENDPNGVTSDGKMKVSLGLLNSALWRDFSFDMEIEKGRMAMKKEGDGDDRNSSRRDAAE